MILSEKIILLRKRNNWSQEEFASLMEVSRQAVSKWELAQSVPELDKLLLMAQLFGVSTDYLLKDEMEIEEHLESELDYKMLRVTLKDANTYLQLKEKTSYYVALGVMLCILSPTFLIGLNGVAATNSNLSERVAHNLGLSFLITFVAIAVALFLYHNNLLSPFAYLSKEVFEVEYGVTSLVKQKQENYRPRHQLLNTFGIILIILSVLTLFITELLNLPLIKDINVVFLLIFVAIGVFALVLSSSRNNAYLILLQEGDHSRQKKRQSTITGAIAAIYWMITTAYYLFTSFTKFNWEKSWVIWPVAGVLFGALMIGIETYYEHKYKSQ